MSQFFAGADLSAAGDVFGPASSTDNAIARFDGATGKLIQNSVVIVNDSGDMSGVGTLTANTLNLNTPLAVQYGGTGINSLTANRLLVGNGTSAVNSLQVGWGNSIMGTFSAGPITMPRTYVQGINGVFLNLSISISGNVVTVAGADGTALGINNPAIVSLPANATDGYIKQRVLTANLTYDFDDLTGALFNMPTGENHANSFPVYLGVVLSDDDNSTINCISVLPNVLYTPSTGTDIGTPAAPSNAGEQWSVFLTQSVTAADYTDHHVAYFGSVTCTRNGSDEWTVDALDMQYDGIGKFQENRTFTVAAGLFGASAGSYIPANGGTSPVFSTNDMNWNISKDGMFTCAWDMEDDGGTDGSGAVISRVAVPFAANDQATDRLVCGGGFVTNSVDGAREGVSVIFTGSSDLPTIAYNDNSSPLQSDWGNGSKRWGGNVQYLVRSYG